MLAPVADPKVRGHVRTLYIGSGILFLATVALGFLNIFTSGDLPRGQVLAHFHSGTIGWVTLSIIATTLWVYTGDRAPTAGEGTFVQLLVWVGLASVAGYILAFYLAFNGTGPFGLLPLFGIPTVLVIIGAFAFTLWRWRVQAVLTTVHLLLFGALLVASWAAIMGALWGLVYATGISPYPAGAEPVGAHAGPMDMYLALAFGAIVELFVRKDDTARWSKTGMTQMVLGVLSAFVVWVSLFFGIMQLAPVGLLLFLASFGFFFGRMGWRTFTRNPLDDGRSAGLFFGGLFFPVYIFLFVYLVFAFFIPGNPLPHALEVLFVHATFIGMATNLVIAAQLGFAASPRPDRLAIVGVWFVNLGFAGFIAGEYMAGRGDGAALMGLGVILALIALWQALGAQRKADAAAAGT